MSTAPLWLAAANRLFLTSVMLQPVPYFRFSFCVFVVVGGGGVVVVVVAVVVVASSAVFLIFPCACLH